MIWATVVQLPKLGKASPDSLAPECPKGEEAEAGDLVGAFVGFDFRWFLRFW